MGNDGFVLAEVLPAGEAAERVAGLWNHLGVGLYPGEPLSCRVTLGNQRFSFLRRFPHPYDGKSNSFSLIELPRLNVPMHEEHLTLCSALTRPFSFSFIFVDVFFSRGILFLNDMFLNLLSVYLNTTLQFCKVGFPVFPSTVLQFFLL